MKLRDLKKFLEQFEDDMDIQIKGFPPEMEAVDIRYDIHDDKMLIIPNDQP